MKHPSILYLLQRTHSCRWALVFVWVLAVSFFLVWVFPLVLGSAIGLLVTSACRLFGGARSTHLVFGNRGIVGVFGFASQNDSLIYYTVSSGLVVFCVLVFTLCVPFSPRTLRKCFFEKRASSPLVRLTVISFAVVGTALSAILLDASGRWQDVVYSSEVKLSSMVVVYVGRWWVLPLLLFFWACVGGGVAWYVLPKYGSFRRCIVFILALLIAGLVLFSWSSIWYVLGSSSGTIFNAERGGRYSCAFLSSISIRWLYGALVWVALLLSGLEDQVSKLTVCEHCGYDLRGNTTGRGCPECGNKWRRVGGMP